MLRAAAIGLHLVLLVVVASGVTASPIAAPEIETVTIPPGPFIAGSSAEEREAAYRLDERAYGHRVTREQRWYENERDTGRVTSEGFEITRAPITNRQYALFVTATGHPGPDVDPDSWKSYRLVHPYERTRRHAWRDGSFPPGRADHPVVMVSHGDAREFASWLSRETGRRWRLPNELEWERAARGDDGRFFPWGPAFAPSKLNSHDEGPFDTMPVGSFPQGASPHGLLDGAGQVYEWTADTTKNQRAIVKGGSWDDKGCGVCRPAARHTRPIAIKHILIGFRLVRE